MKSSALTPVGVALGLALVFTVAGIQGQAQSARLGGPRDWSSNRLVGNRFGPDHGANTASNWRTVMKHAQIDQALASRTTTLDWLADLRDRFRPKTPAQLAKLDWNLSTGGTGPVVGTPAKYSFDISTWNCSDVIYYTVNQNGSATAMNVIAITNAYVTCPGNPAGATPTVKFAFAMASGTATSVVPSLNGEQIYVLESRPAGVVLHAINVNLVGANAAYTFGTSAWTGGRALSTTGMGVGGEQLFEMTFTGVVNNLSSPYLDYDGTQLFFGDSAGRIHRVSNVHTASPIKDVTNFPVPCGTAALQSPVFYDPPLPSVTTGQIVTTSADGRAYRISTTVPPPGGLYTCIGSALGGAGTGVGVGGGLSAPVIDVTNEEIIIAGNYANAGAFRGIGMVRLAFTAGEAQSSGQAVGAAVGTLAPQPPSFDEAFWSTGTGNLYIPGSLMSGGASTYLVRVPYNGTAVGTPAGFATLTRTGTAQTFATSPVTEFLTASSLANKDFVFVGGATGNAGGNYRYINRIGAGFAGTDAVPVAMAGSFQFHATGGGVVSGIVVDTRTASVTGSMATANVYFGTVGDAGGGIPSRIIQLAQQF